MQGSLHRAWGVAGPSADGRFSGDGDEEDQEDGACLEMAGEAGGAAGVGLQGSSPCQQCCLPSATSGSRPWMCISSDYMSL